jgi:Radical SAM superfamily
MPDLNTLGSPYLAGILDAADEQMLLLETTRGCVFKCKFCYYPKSYDGLYFLGRETILANLRHAADRGVREVFLLDPTLNQRKDFAALLQTLAEGNPDRAFSYFGELRGEGITPESAALLRQANFTEVEVGLQSIDRDAMHLMDRNNNLKAFERGVRAMAAEGIKVKVDLIIGLPGDTVDSVRRGLHYLKDRGLDDDVQVFNLSVLPGTDFRREAIALGLKHQPRPPYYVLQTPTLSRAELFQLMQEVQELFDIEFDAQQPPVLDFPPADSAGRLSHHDFDSESKAALPDARNRSQAFTLWLRAADLDAHRHRAAMMIEQILTDNPFTTLQVLLEPGEPASVSPRLLEILTEACQSRPTYLDKFYALQPGRPNGAKRLIVLLAAPLRSRLEPAWLDEVGALATIVWRGGNAAPLAAELEPYEYAL